MAWKFSKMIITVEERELGRNPFRLFITSIYSIEWDRNKTKRKVTPRVVPSLVHFVENSLLRLFKRFPIQREEQRQRKSQNTLWKVTKVIFFELLWSNLKNWRIATLDICHKKSPKTKFIGGQLGWWAGEPSLNCWYKNCLSR